jgi:hypothetical protein
MVDKATEMVRQEGYPYMGMSRMGKVRDTLVRLKREMGQ